MIGSIIIVSYFNMVIIAICINNQVIVSTIKMTFACFCTYKTQCIRLIIMRCTINNHILSISSIENISIVTIVTTFQMIITTTAI